MSVELETIERLFDAVHRNDVQSYVQCFAEDAEYKVANFPAVHGRADIEAFGARITPISPARSRRSTPNSWWIAACTR